MKTRFFALAALLFGMAACQTDPMGGLEVDANGEAAVSVSVALPEGATRAAGTDSALGAIDNGIDLDNEYDIRFILEVYDANGELAKDRMVVCGDEDKATFNFRLVPGRDYKFVVWADFVANDSTAETVQDLHYETTNGLRLVAIKDWTVIDESRDAYTAAVDVKNYSGASQIEPIVLTRPFAKLRVVTNDIKEMITLRPDIVKVNYFNTKFYTAFDAFAENPIDQSYTGHELIVDLKEDFYTNEKPEETGVQTLFADYFFAQEGDRVMFTMDVVFNDNESLPQPVVFNTNIPVKRNNLTTVYGPILTDANNVTVTIDPAFENQLNPNDPPYYVEVLSGNMNEGIELTKSGSYVFEDLTVNADQAVVVKNGANVVIDIKGYAKLNGKKGIVVEDGATLTINGLSKTRTEERAGNLVVVATEGSAIGGKFITINNLAGLTAKAGDVNGAFGIGADNAEVEINNTKIDYVSGAYVQPLFVNDTKYGKSEPEGASAIGGQKVVLNGVELVKAEGGSKAAAIGNRFWSNTEVIIKNSTLKDVFGGNASAAIGGSRVKSDVTAENKQEVKITIENSTIENAVGGQYGAGIGFGYDTHCTANGTNCVNNIVIINSTITAKGGMYAAGIGTGFHTAALTGSIDAASKINATSGDKFYKDSYTAAQNIGYGIVDPDREYMDQVVSFTVAGNVISRPSKPVVGENDTIVEGLGKDIENENQYHVSEPEALTYIADQVNEGNDKFNKAEIVLSNDIDLSQFALTRSASNWTPIGTEEKPFTGTFDGNGKTIKNLVINGGSQRNIGFFGVTMNGEIKNVTFENAKVSGRLNVGVVAGTPYTSKYTNITVKGHVEVDGMAYVGAVGGKNAYANWTNVTVNVDETSYVNANSVENGTAYRTYVGGVVGFNGEGGHTFYNIHSNINVKGSTCDVGGLFGIAHYNNNFVNCVCEGDVEIYAASEEAEAQEIGGIAGVWHNENGTKVTFTNCSFTGELKANNDYVINTKKFGNLVCSSYNNTGNGILVIDGTEYTLVDGDVVINGCTPVSTADELIAALAAGKDVIFANDITVAATKGGYNKAGILQNKAQTINGNGHTLTVTGAGATWDCAIYTNGGLIKNLTVAGAMRGVFTAGTSSDLFMENVTFKNVIYTFNSDGGSKNYGVYISNSTLNGWTSHSDVHKEVVYTNCNFGEGSGYKYCRPYGKTEFVNCTFCAGYTVDKSQTNDITFTNCTFEE